MFPFIMAIAFGFLMGAITTFFLLKIKMLENENKKLIKKFKSFEREEDTLEDTKTQEKEDSNLTKINKSFKEDTNKTTEDKDKSKEEKKSEETKEKEKEKILNSLLNKEDDDNKPQDNKLEGVESIIKKDPDFKRPVIKKKEINDDDEWSVVKKNSKSKKPK